MSETPQKIVEQAYDHIAEWYLGWVESQRSPREKYARKVVENAGPNPRILDLGCGPGVPITRMLLDNGCSVVANDISTKQLNMAKARCPEATFISGDMMNLSFEPASFDGIISFYTVFHLPRTQQKVMLAKVHSWLKQGGMFTFNLATLDEEEIHGEFFGYGMFWSSYSEEDSIKMVRDVGLEVLEAEVCEAGDGQLEEGEPDQDAKFLWITAKRGLSGTE